MGPVLYCFTSKFAQNAQLHLGKTHGTISAVQMDFVQIAFQPPPPLKQPDPLGLLFSPKISQFFKTAVLTMGIDIVVDNGEI